MTTFESENLDIMEIFGKKIRPGESAVVELDVTKQKTRNHTTIPVFVERSKHPGPTLLLTGGVHGDETNGIAIVRDIMRNGYHKPLIGTVLCIPVLNIFGFLNHSRYLPDGRDLNRVMPGRPNGSLASQLAYMYITEIAHLPDYVIDFHAGGRDLVNYPNIRCDFNRRDSLKLAELFDAPFTVHSDAIPDSIRAYYDEHDKISILYEGGKSMELDPFVIRTGVEGALNVMRHLGMQRGEVRNENPDRMLYDSQWLRAEHLGMFQHTVDNGSRVTKGSAVGMIIDPYAEFEMEVTAPFDMYIFGVNTAPFVFPGDPLFHVSEIYDSLKKPK